MLGCHNGVKPGRFLLDPIWYKHAAFDVFGLLFATMRLGGARVWFA